MIKFINDLINHVEVGKVKLLYTDTDSYHFGLAADLDDLVKEDMRESWFGSIKPRTFVQNNDNVVECCTPG